MDCERCSAELPEGGNFCSNCGEPRPDEVASGVDQTRPCRDCAEQVQVGAGFCWNCGARSPHGAPAVTGNTVVRKAPPDPSGPGDNSDFEWSEGSPSDAPSVGPLEPGGQTMRRGSGTPRVVQAEPTIPRSVRPGLPSGAAEALAEAEPPTSSPFQDDAAKLPQRVASMIAEELGEEPAVDPATLAAEEAAEDGSEPLSLEADVDAAVAQAQSTSEPAKISEEVAELQFLMLRGFHTEAELAYQLLIEAHPGHPDLLALGEELAANKAAAPASPDASVAPPTSSATETESVHATATSPVTSSVPDDDRAATPAVNENAPTDTDGLPDITVVTHTTQRAESEAEDEDAALIEAPTSPTFVEGTSPPAGGFAVTPAVPQVVQPNVTPRLEIHAPERSHMPSSESLPTNPRMPMADIDTTAVSKPAGVRLVMLGKRGEAVWERLLGADGMLEIGRTPDDPWGDDPHIEPAHARLFVIPGGGLRIEPMGRSGVYRQVDERLAVRDGDEFRVGESLLRYSTKGGGWGAVTCYPMSGTTCNTIPIGGSGLIIGRENADIELPEDTFVSGAHCKFACRDEGLFIEDMGSANGTYSRLRSGEAVPYGALLLLGQTQFKVRRPSP